MRLYLKQIAIGEQKIEQVLTLFSGLTIFIACLGLFGLATFTAEQRTKEIGVQKILGASAGSAVALLSLDFLKPTLIALALASPVTWWDMNQWLKNLLIWLRLTGVSLHWQDYWRSVLLC